MGDLLLFCYSQGRKGGRSILRFRQFVGISALAVAGVVLGVVVLAAATLEIPLAQFTRDPAVLANTSAFYGVVSTLGSLAWAGAAGIWLLCASLAPSGPSRRFALASLGFTLYLCIDDTFMLHESAAPRRLGIPEDAVVGTIVLVGIVYVGLEARRLLRTPLLAMAAFGCLALSVLADALAGMTPPYIASYGFWQMLLEDGTKWMGIVFWAALALAQARLELRGPRAESAASQAPTPTPRLAGTVPAE